MKTAALIPALLAATFLAGAAHAGTKTAPVIVIDVPHCSSHLSPYVCPADEAELARMDLHYAGGDEQILPLPGANDEADDAAAAPIPEPQMFAMILIGLVLFGFTSTRREAYDKFSA